MRWPWDSREDAKKAGREGGLCEHPGCAEYAMYVVNGCSWLCWEHYVEMMKKERATK